MDARAKNPIRGVFKGSIDSRNRRETVKRQNEGHKKQARATEVQKRRKIEQSPEEKAPKADKRREQLIAWKLERDRKRQFEIKKKEFVVKHVKHSPTKYLVSDALKKAGRKQIAPENQACNRRITRSYAKNCAKQEEVKKGNKNPVVSKKTIQTRSRKERNDNEDIKKRSPKTISPTEQVKSFENGFAFSFNQDDMLPTTFKFCQNSPAANFALNELEFNDPIAKFNESLKITNEESKKGSMEVFDFATNDVIAKFNEAVRIDNGDAINDAKKSDSFIKKLLVDPIERFNSSLKDESIKEKTEPVKKAENEMSLISDKMDIQCNESISNKMESPLSKPVLKGRPGKTPKKPKALPKHILEEISGDGFTPRRIKSTAHFRKLVEGERQKLEKFNNIWSKYLEEQDQMGLLSEDVTGLIRSVIGKAQLLMDQRFKQFEDLINLHQSHKAEQGATASDLQGFWDMVDFQIEDVNKKFAELETSKQNNWVKEKPKRVLKTKKTVETKKINSAKVISRQEEIRKFKEKMRAKMGSLKSESDVMLESNQEENKGEEPEGSKLSPIRKTPIRRSTRKTPLKNKTSAEEDDVFLIQIGNDIPLSKTEETNEPNKLSPIRRPPARKSIRKTPSKAKTSADEDNVFLIQIENDIPLKSNVATEDKENNVFPLLTTPVRRSTRRTPSKNKTPANLNSDFWVKSDNVEDPGFLKYLRPSVSEDNNDDLLDLPLGSPINATIHQSSLQSADVSLIKFD